MTDYADLQKRLNEFLECGADAQALSGKLLDEAADALAALVAERDRLQGAQAESEETIQLLMREGNELWVKLAELEDAQVHWKEYKLVNDSRAKLKRVRQWRRLNISTLSTGQKAALDAILDGPNDVAEPPNPPHTLNECIFDGQCGDEHLQDKDATAAPTTAKENAP